MRNLEKTGTTVKMSFVLRRRLLLVVVVVFVDHLDLSSGLFC